MRRDKIGMGYESLHKMELLSVQCLQVDDCEGAQCRGCVEHEQ